MKPSWRAGCARRAACAPASLCVASGWYGWLCLAHARHEQPGCNGCASSANRASHCGSHATRPATAAAARRRSRAAGAAGRRRPRPRPTRAVDDIAPALDGERMSSNTACRARRVLSGGSSACSRCAVSHRRRKGQRSTQHHYRGRAHPCARADSRRSPDLDHSLHRAKASACHGQARTRVRSSFATGSRATRARPRHAGARPPPDNGAQQRPRCAPARGCRPASTRRVRLSSAMAAAIASSRWRLGPLRPLVPLRRPRPAARPRSAARVGCTARGAEARGRARAARPRRHAAARRAPGMVSPSVRSLTAGTPSRPWPSPPLPPARPWRRAGRRTAAAPVPRRGEGSALASGGRRRRGPTWQPACGAGGCRASASTPGAQPAARRVRARGGGAGKRALDSQEARPMSRATTSLSPTVAQIGGQVRRHAVPRVDEHAGRLPAAPPAKVVAPRRGG